MLQLIFDYFIKNAHQFSTYLLQHLGLSITALLISIFFGMPLGYFATKNKTISIFATGSSQVLRIIPSLALLFILIPVIGVGLMPALIALVFLGVPPIMINTILGFQEVPTIVKESARGLGMDDKQLFKRIELPLSMPHLLNGIKLAFVEIIASTTLAAYIGAGGLGSLIMTGLGLYRLDLLLIGGASVALLSLFSILLMDTLIRKVTT